MRVTPIKTMATKKRNVKLPESFIAIGKLVFNRTLISSNSKDSALAKETALLFNGEQENCKIKANAFLAECLSRKMRFCPGFA